MASELLLVNPRRKRRRSKRRMSALQRSYFGARRNPRKRRRKSASLAVAAAPRRVSRRRRGRVGRAMRRGHARAFKGFTPRSFINDTLMPAGVGAVGALGVDMTLAYASPYLPPFLASGIGNSIARIGGAIGVGYVASMAMGRRFGDQVTAGALTVTLYDLIKSQIRTMGIPGIAGLGWISPSMQVGSYDGTYTGSLSSYDGTYQGSLSGLGVPYGMGQEVESDYYQYH